jgi:UDP-2,3-diacylglucosamine pyrophosphatase LpxH
MELVLNGDVFDFDAVTQQPAEDLGPLSWLERLRGLNASEPKSTWKMRRILDDHPEFVEALRAWVEAGHDLVFVVGNHDLELHWPGVQLAVLDAVGSPERVRFCDFFYRSNGDTLIEHGNQYDTYCLCLDPLWPTIEVGDEALVRLPFGNYASRIIVNGVGFFNPHAESTWNMSFTGYVVFFYRYILRVAPLLPLTWIWTSIATWILSMRDGILPPRRDVLRLEERVEEVAERARATTRTVRGLIALRAHPAILTPWRIAKELWLDRLFLFALLVIGSFQVLATTNMVVGVSAWWWFVLLAILFPPFLFYARTVNTETDGMDRYVHRRIDLISGVAGVSRLVLGHSHDEMHTHYGSTEVLNPGTWSPAFLDPECTEPDGRTCVVWIRPGPDGERVASVEIWTDPGLRPLPYRGDHPTPSVQLPSPANLLA